MNKSFICISILLISSINSDYIKGINVSKYKGNIDWNKVKNEVGFAIIRMGCGYNENDMMIILKQIIKMQKLQVFKLVLIYFHMQQIQQEQKQKLIML